MKIKYEIEEYEPEREYMLVKFTSPDNPDWVYYKSLNPPDFSKDKLVELLEACASVVTGFWGRAIAHDAECPIPMTGDMDVEPEVYLAQEIHPIIEPQPEFDVWTEYVVQDDLTSPFQETIGWVVVKYTAEELELNYQHLEASARMDRNDALSRSDFVHAPDAGVSNLEDWLEFRQALRDLPETSGWPKNITWPQWPSIKK